MDLKERRKLFIALNKEGVYVVPTFRTRDFTPEGLLAEVTLWASWNCKEMTLVFGEFLPSNERTSHETPPVEIIQEIRKVYSKDHLKINIPFSHDRAFNPQMDLCAEKITAGATGVITGGFTTVSEFRKWIAEHEQYNATHPDKAISPANVILGINRFAAAASQKEMAKIASELGYQTYSRAPFYDRPYSEYSLSGLPGSQIDARLLMTVGKAPPIPAAHVFKIPAPPALDLSTFRAYTRNVKSESSPIDGKKFLSDPPPNMTGTHKVIVHDIQGTPYVLHLFFPLVTIRGLRKLCIPQCQLPGLNLPAVSVYRPPFPTNFKGLMLVHEKTPGEAYLNHEGYVYMPVHPQTFNRLFESLAPQSPLSFATPSTPTPGAEHTLITTPISKLLELFGLDTFMGNSKLSRASVLRHQGELLPIGLKHTFPTHPLSTNTLSANRHAYNAEGHSYLIHRITHSAFLFTIAAKIADELSRQQIPHPTEMAYALTLRLEIPMEYLQSLVAAEPRVDRVLTGGGVYTKEQITSRTLVNHKEFCAHIRESMAKGDPVTVFDLLTGFAHRFPRGS